MIGMGDFEAALSVLVSMDESEFIEAVFDMDCGEFSREEYAVACAFQAAPHVWFISAPHEQRQKLWAYIEKRLAA